MKKILAAATMVALSTVAASAADLGARPMYSKAPVAAPAYSWTGFYVGANIGSGWASRDVVPSPNISTTHATCVWSGI